MTEFVILLIIVVFGVKFLKKLEKSHNPNKRYNHKQKEKHNFIIYKATNKKNSKVYIGSTKYRDLNKRKYWHHKDAFDEGKQTPFYNALREYGARAFQWEVIERMYSTKAQVENREYGYINQYRNKLGYDNVYNRIGSRQQMWQVIQKRKQYI